MNKMESFSFIAFLLAMLFKVPSPSFGQSDGKTQSALNKQDNSPVDDRMKKALKSIADIFTFKSELIVMNDAGTGGNSWGTPKEMLVFDDRMEFRFKKESKIIYFSDILDCNITAAETDIMTPDGKSVIRGKSQISIRNMVLEINGYGHAQDLRDKLIVVQEVLNERKFASDLLLFEPVAAKYRELKVKPPVNEEQRKYIVQANSFNEQKLYSKAIELYKKAIELDRTAYPAAYSNLALLSAQEKKYTAAIFYMKMYLILAPDATDARSAQDKIYEWEAR
jgi:tetratricopeptide (TPR) repeat protein